MMLNAIYSKEKFHDCYMAVTSIKEDVYNVFFVFDEGSELKFRIKLVGRDHFNIKNESARRLQWISAIEAKLIIDEICDFFSQTVTYTYH